MATTIASLCRFHHMIDDDNLGLAGSKKATPPEIKTIEKTKTNAVIDWIL